MEIKDLYNKTYQKLQSCCSELKNFNVENFVLTPEIKFLTEKICYLNKKIKILEELLNDENDENEESEKEFNEQLEKNEES